MIFRGDLIVYNCLQAERGGGKKDNVNSLKKRFETSNMKDDEAYVIM